MKIVTLRLLYVVLAELGPGLRHAAAHILLLHSVVVLQQRREFNVVF
jgi:hypothetical protein